MARVYFLYRSKKETAALKVRLQFKEGDSKFFQFESNTQIHTSRKFWNETLKKKRGLTASEKNEIASVNKKLLELEKLIVERFEIDMPQPEDNQWLKQVLKEHYTPEQKEKFYPVYLTDFFDAYVRDKKELNDLKENQRKRINTTRNKLKRIEKELSKKYKIKDVNDDFKINFIQYSESKKYSVNTQNGDFERIKTICRYAGQRGIETNPRINDIDFKIKKEKVPKIYFESHEIEKIEKVKLKHNYLENARDWLLISIYSGQRISDFMRFNKEMINTDESGRSFIVFEQVKTKHEMYLPLRPEIKAILDKRKGEFPRQISDQKYNDYIKEVCQEAEINTICEGKKRICVEPDKSKATKYDYRNVLGKFEKWELVSSHIGRRTFATLNYGNIPTPDLMYFTGHTTEKEFLNYIVRPDYDKAKRAFDSFNTASKPKEIPTLSIIKNDAVNQ